MKRLLLMNASIMLLAAGCGMPPAEVGVTTEALSHGDIERGGGDCQRTSNGWLCTQCYIVSPDKQVGVCIDYVCFDNGDGTDTCMLDPLASYDPDITTIWSEAEAATLLAPMQKVPSAGASSGVAVSGTGSAVFKINVGASKTFYPWVRTKAPGTNANSYAIQINKGPSVAFDVPVSSGFTWNQVQRVSDTERTRFTLGAGLHTVRISGLEAGVTLNRILLVDADGFVPVADTVEAESGARVAPMAEGVFSGTRYMSVPNGSGPGGILDLQTPVPQQGLYSVWGRVNAPSTSDNAFTVSSDLGPQAQWHTPITPATGWTWAQVTHGTSADPYLFELDGGFSFVRFARLDDGTRLDKIIVTNDPGFIPSN